MGDYIDGSQHDGLGSSVSMSHDGTRVIVGVPMHDTGCSNGGTAFVYEWDSTSWVRMGSDMTATCEQRQVSNNYGGRDTRDSAITTILAHHYLFSRTAATSRSALVQAIKVRYAYTNGNPASGRRLARLWTTMQKNTVHIMIIPVPSPTAVATCRNLVSATPCRSRKIRRELVFLSACQGMSK